MDLLDILKARRSIRSFTSAPVEKQKLDTIPEAAKWAPSAGNAQARDFILISDKETKEKLAEAAFGQDFVSGAPEIIVVCANPRADQRNDTVCEARASIPCRMPLPQCRTCSVWPIAWGLRHAGWAHSTNRK